MSDLPKEWMDTNIGSIADVTSGGTPQASDPSNFAAPGTSIPWLTPADLSGYKHKVISHGARDLSEKGYESCSAKLIPAGSLLFSSRAPIGYIAIAANEVSTSQGFKSFTFPKYINPSYAYYFLKSIRSLAESLGTGTTFKELSGTTAKTLPFRLAPLAEQTRIAQKLDDLLAQVENLKSRVDTIPTLLKRFRRSVLAAAVSGRLTDDWRNSHDQLSSAFELHKKLRQAHDAEGGHARGNASKPTEKAHDLTSDELPDTWDIADLRDICVPGRPITYGILKPGPELEFGVPYIRVADFPGNKLDFSRIKNTSPEIDLQYKRARLTAGDLLLSIRGSVGRLIKIPEELEGANITQDTARLSISPLTSTDFIYWVLLADSTQLRMKKAIRGVAVRGINIGDVRALQIPLPPPEEQAEIVHRVEQFFVYADEVEAKVSIALSHINKLSQTILAKAFRGELTESWRADNQRLITGEHSAEALLEKIKAERELKIKLPVSKPSPKPTKMGKKMRTSIIKVSDALKEADRPLSGQELLTAAGYPNDSTTEELEQFFLDVRDSIGSNKIIKQDRDNSGQDWFALAEAR